MEFLLIVIAGILLWIAYGIGDIGKRLKERFPTEKELDHEWAKKDSMGHWEAHKDDDKLKKT